MTTTIDILIIVLGVIFFCSLHDNDRTLKDEDSRFILDDRPCLTKTNIEKKYKGHKISPNVPKLLTGGEIEIL